MHGSRRTGLESVVPHSSHQPVTHQAELVERARHKDSAAVKIIIQQHNQRLYRIARSIVRDATEAEHSTVPGAPDAQG